MTVSTRARRRSSDAGRGSGTSAVEDVRAGVQGLLAPVAAASAATERDRHVPDELMVALKAAGALGVFRPQSHGGAGVALPDALEVFEMLGTADASTAWVVALAAVGWTDLAGLPGPVFDALWADGTEPLVSLVFAPGGSSTAVEGGYLVTGRWAFASGCRHAEWFAGSTIDDEGRMRLVLFEAAQVVVEDTWQVAGLRGTGSHHVSAQAVSVPVDRTLVVFEDPPCIDDPSARVHPPALFAAAIASVALGAAQGALDDVAGIAGTKTPLLSSSTLRQSPPFHHMVADADTTIRACRSVLRESAQLGWDIAVEARQPSDTERARMRAGAAWVVERCADVVTAAYRAGGGGALYEDSPLQRRLRDVNAVTQHFLVRPDTASKAGALLLGEAIDLPVF